MGTKFSGGFKHFSDFKSGTLSEDKNWFEGLKNDSDNSVSTIRNNSFPGSFEKIWLNGYYGKNTPGGGPFYRDSNDTTTPDNGFTVIVDSDGVRWKRPTQAVYDVYQAGAKLNGSTDDTDAFQTATDNATHVFVPEGSGPARVDTWQITQPGTIVEFARNAVVKANDSNPNHIVIIQAPRCALINPRLNGNKANTSNERNLVQVEDDDCFIYGLYGENASRHAIFALNVNNLMVQDLHVNNFDKDGIQVLKCQSVRIYGVYAQNVRYATAVEEGSKDIAIHGLSVYSSLQAIRFIIHSGSTSPINDVLVDGIYCESTDSVTTFANSDGIVCENMIFKNVSGRNWSDLNSRLGLFNANNTVLENWYIRDRDNSSTEQLLFVGMSDIRISGFDYDVTDTTSQHIVFKDTGNVIVSESRFRAGGTQLFYVNDSDGVTDRNFRFNDLFLELVDNVNWIKLTGSYSNIHLTNSTETNNLGNRFLSDPEIKITDCPGVTPKNGSVSFSGDGSTVEFDIDHGLNEAPSRFTVNPTSPDSAGNFYFGTISPGIIRVTFLSAPPSGTDNVTFDWWAAL